MVQETPSRFDSGWVPPAINVDTVTRHGAARHHVRCSATACKPHQPCLTPPIRTQAERCPHKEPSVRVYLTSSFVFDDAEEMRAAFADEIDRNIYSRFTYPNVTEFVDKIWDLEGAEAGNATATGMPAVFATFAGLLGVGDHIVSGRAIFGSTHTILTKIVPRFGMTHSYVDVADGLGAWEAAITPATRMIYVETPTNPGLEIADLVALGELANTRRVLLVVDKCMSIPVLQ